MWGETTQIGMSKVQVEQFIKEYVNKQYPKKVKDYQAILKKIRDKKLKKYKDVIYVSGNLMWQDTIDNRKLKFTTLGAKLYCKKLKLATKKDWRLPAYTEMLQLINYFRYEPAVVDAIEHVVPVRYWTGTHDIADVSASWYVDFNYGETGVTLRQKKLNVRCVRDMLDIEGDF